MAAVITPFRRPGRFSMADRVALIAAARSLPGGHAVRFEVDEAGDAWATIGPAVGGDPWMGLFDAFLVGWERDRLTLTEVASGQELGRFGTAGEVAQCVLAHAALHPAPTPVPLSALAP